jgi:uncharacterized integral membrane protein
MPISIRKLFFATIFNFSLLLMLIIGIQNSSSKSKVNLIINQSVKLPISFIIGVSFISGSLIGNFLSLQTPNKK